MAIIQLSEILSNIRGSIGGTTFSRNKAGLIAKRKMQGVKNYTAKQANVIKTQSYIVGQWQSLTLIEQELWNDYSDLYEQVDRFGTTKQLSGFNWFCHVNNYNYVLNNSIISSPPARLDATPLPSFNVLASDATLKLRFSDAIALTDEVLYIFASHPLQQTNKSNRGNLRLVKTIVNPTVDDVDITTDWETAFNCVWSEITPNSSFTIQAFCFTLSSLSFQNSVGQWAVGKLNELPPDPDALAYLEAAEITYGTVWNAVNNLVYALKDADVWGNIHGFWPLQGIGATNRKWNLINPLDTDAAFRLVFYGGWTHDENGSQPNGVNGYCNTFLNANTEIAQFKACFGFCNNAGTLSGTSFEGAFDGANGFGNALGNGLFYNDVYANTIGYTPSVNGRWMDRRSANNDHQAYLNGASLGTNTTVSSANNANVVFYWGVGNFAGTPTYYSGQGKTYMWIAENLTHDQCIALDAILDTYNTAVGR